MYSSDQKILDLIDFLKYQKIVTSIKDFCSQIKMTESTVTKIKSSKAHFTPKHIEKICKVFYVNANWIFGIENNMFLPNNRYKLNDFPGNINDNVKRQ